MQVTAVRDSVLPVTDNYSQCHGCGVTAVTVLSFSVMAVLAPSHSPQDSDIHPSPSYSP